MIKNSYYFGLDIGSTTVKGVLLKNTNGEKEIVWKKYERHETRQAEKVLDYLHELEALFPEIFKINSTDLRIFLTGSGGSAIEKVIGAKYYQEVLCVSYAVEKFHPDVNSVIELGGQDAKIILYKDSGDPDQKRKIMTMNDKCAGGTGAVIDKISGKLNLNSEKLKKIQYKGIKLHPVAGKCGVFAETDINGLQKLGVPSEELMASLFEAIVQQNLSVLTRGNTIIPKVILLGGPNTFIPGLQDAWRENFQILWNEREVELPKDLTLEELVFVPEDGAYFAALGAVSYGMVDHIEESASLLYAGSAKLQAYIEERKERISGHNSGLAKDAAELLDFKKKYIPQNWIPPVFEEGLVIKGYMGLDGGSTSTKGVLIDENGDIVATEYLLSKGNPIEDTIQVIRGLREQIEKNGATLQIAGIGTTGYAKDILKDIFQCDIAVVETVAHTIAAKTYYPHVDVIVDVGGQDIKIIHLKDGIIKDFKLNTQCSAGNGYFLQNTAEGFGYNVTEFSDVAFSATKFPQFGYGCAVFLQTDIVDFQRQGWEAPEILAGLADVLPKNIWQYVAKIPNLSSLGKTFVLQGGTQKNIAAVKSQVDYIKDKFNGESVEPEVIVHKFTNVCGAIGAAFEAKNETVGPSRFIGLDKAIEVKYESHHNEETRCYYCKNKCIRTFIDVSLSNEENSEKRRLIIAPCEKGSTEDVKVMKLKKREIETIKSLNPNVVEEASKLAWKEQADSVANIQKEMVMNIAVKFFSNDKNKRKERANKVIGFPRVLLHYNLQPFYTAYFESLGYQYKNFVFSDFTSEKMFKEGSKRGTVDPCFPAKISLAHIHDLLEKNKKRKIDYIFFPAVQSYSTGLSNVIDNRACPTVTGATDMAYSAFTKESDTFGEHGIQFLKPFLKMDMPAVVEKEFYQDLKETLNLSVDENKIAIHAGFAALKEFKKSIEKRGREIIDQVKSQKRIALVLIARTYHNDPGVNHGILELFQERGYPVLPMSALPTDKEFLGEVFSDSEDYNMDPMDIDDVWKNSFSASSSLKIWASKVIARHPNLIPIELSSFKCGHDSTLYSTIEKIMEKSDTPFFSFKDIDENNPAGSIKIRVETIDYFLSKYIQKLNDKKNLLSTRLEKIFANS